MDVPLALAEAIARGKDDVPFFAQFFLDVYLHDGQVRFSNSANSKINVLVPGNRYGKSVELAVRHLHKAFYKAGDGWWNFHFAKKPYSKEAWNAAKWESINASISADQAEIVYREILAMCARPKMAPFIKATPVTPFPHVKLWNGSVIHARSTSDNGKYIDGHHYAYMSYDEAGWEPKLDWLMGTVLLPRLTDWGGMLDVVGTPKGRGYLYQLMMRGLNGDPGVYVQQGSSYENPYVPREEIEALERELMAISPKLARQAIYGDFVDVDGLVFTFDQVQGNMVDPSIEYERRAVAFGIDFEDLASPPDPLRRYHAAFDLARRSDRTVGYVLDTSVKPFRLVRGLHLTGCPWEHQYEYIKRIAREYGCEPVIDSTGLGDVVDAELTTRGIPHKTFSFNDGRGLVKQQLITNLQNALDYGRTSDGGAEPMPYGLIRCGLMTPLLEEMAIYQWNDKDLPTDSVMALAMVVWDAYRAPVVAQAVKASLRGRRGRR